MTADLRLNAFLSLLATASLCISAGANAGPTHAPVKNGPATAPAAARLHFPDSLTVDGKRYDRLTGTSLEQAVRGKTFCPSPPCSGIDGSVEVFQHNGDYVVFGDRWDDQGRYAIANDLVVTKLADESRNYAFYRSADGTVRRAFDDGAGIVRSMIEFAK